MPFLRIRASAAVILPILFSLSAGLCAETLRMKDGRVLEGRIIAQTRTHVQLQTGTGTLLLPKTDIAQIIFRPAAPENRKAEERSPEPIKPIKTVEDSVRESAEAEERRRAEEAHRQAALRLRRHELDAGLSLSGGSSRTVSERVYSDILRQRDRDGQYLQQVPWKAGAMGANLDVLYKYDSWRADAGIFYRSMGAGSNGSYAFSNKASLFSMQNPANASVGVSNWTGRARTEGFSVAGEREFWRSERGGLGLRLGFIGWRENVRLSGAEVGSTGDGLFPSDRTIDSRISLGEVTVRWHRYLQSGGEFTLGAGWQSGKSSTDHYATMLPLVTTSHHYVVDVAYSARLQGPVIHMEYARPWLTSWQLVVGVQANRLAVTMGDGSGSVLTYPGNAPFMPYSVITAWSWLTQRPSLVSGTAEIVLGLRHRTVFAP